MYPPHTSVECCLVYTYSFNQSWVLNKFQAPNKSVESVNKILLQIKCLIHI